MIYLIDKDEKLIKIIRKPAIKAALQKYSLAKERYVSDRLTVEMKSLNDDELEKVGRALGHRVWQSIEHYICNHPYVISQFQLEKEQGNDLGEELSNELKNNMDLAFEDQIVQKVMPKLRGIETRGKGEEVLNNILNILLNENFSHLEKDFKFAKEQGFGQFVWGSAYYLNEGEFELSNNIDEDNEIKKEE